MKINNIVYLTDDYVYLKHKKNLSIIDRFFFDTILGR